MVILFIGFKEELSFKDFSTKRSRSVETTSPRHGEVAAATERGCRMLRYMCVICLIDYIMFKFISRKRMLLYCIYVYLCMYVFA